MPPTSSIVLSAKSLERTVSRMADEIVERNDGTDGLILVGIQRRGVELAPDSVTIYQMEEIGRASCRERV